MSTLKIFLALGILVLSAVHDSQADMRGTEPADATVTDSESMRGARTENWYDGDLGPSPEFKDAGPRRQATVLATAQTAVGSTVYFITDPQGGLLVAEVGRTSWREEGEDLSAVESPADLFVALAGSREAAPDALKRFSDRFVAAGSWKASEHLPSAQSGCSFRVDAVDFDGGGVGRTKNQESYASRQAGETSVWWGKNRVSAAGHVCIAEGLASWGFQKQNCNNCGWTWLVDPNAANSLGRLFAGESAWWYYTGGQGNNDFNYHSQIYFISDSTYVHEVSSCYDYYRRTRLWPGSCLAGGCKLRGPGYGTIPGTALRDCDYKGVDPSGIVNPWP